MKFNIFICAFCTGLISQFAFACSCSEKKSVEEEVNSSDLVALVEVLKVEDVYVPDPQLTQSVITQGSEITNQNKTLLGEYLKKVTIKQVHAYKINGDSQIDVIYTPMYETACGFKFKKGRRYIVYAEKRQSLKAMLNETEDVYSTNICKRTKRKNQKELKAIAKVLK